MVGLIVGRANLIGQPKTFTLWWTTGNEGRSNLEARISCQFSDDSLDLKAVDT